MVHLPQSAWGAPSPRAIRAPSPVPPDRATRRLGSCRRPLSAAYPPRRDLRERRPVPGGMLRGDADRREWTSVVIHRVMIVLGADMREDAEDRRSTGRQHTNTA